MNVGGRSLRPEPHIDRRGRVAGNLNAPPTSSAAGCILPASSASPEAAVHPTRIRRWSTGWWFSATTPSRAAAQPVSRCAPCGCWPDATFRWTILNGSAEPEGADRWRAIAGRRAPFARRPQPDAGRACRGRGAGCVQPPGPALRSPSGSGATTRPVRSITCITGTRCCPPRCSAPFIAWRSDW